MRHRGKANKPQKPCFYDSMNNNLKIYEVCHVVIKSVNRFLNCSRRTIKLYVHDIIFISTPVQAKRNGMKREMERYCSECSGVLFVQLIAFNIARRYENLQIRFLCQRHTRSQLFLCCAVLLQLRNMMRSENVMSK